MTTHPIPDAALAHHIAILGKTGSGKTVAAKGMVERILDAGGRVCAVDPTGVWHGLRSSASGKRAGYPVVIFGGLHGDVPLAAGHGEAIAGTPRGGSGHSVFYLARRDLGDHEARQLREPRRDAPRLPPSELTQDGRI